MDHVSSACDVLKHLLKNHTNNDHDDEFKVLVDAVGEIKENTTLTELTNKVTKLSFEKLKSVYEEVDDTIVIGACCHHDVNGESFIDNDIFTHTTKKKTIKINKKNASYS